MGVVTIKAKIKNFDKPPIVIEEEFLVDTGAKYLVIPQKLVKKLKLKTKRIQSFSLADGRIVKRSIGNCLVEYAGIEAATPVVLGEPDDTLLFGIVTLEALGLMVDPFKREIYQSKLMLA